MTNTIREQQQKLAVDTAIRIQKYLSKVWTDDSQEGAVETAKEVSTKIGAYLASMHTGQAKMTAELKKEAYDLITTLCDDDQKTKVTDELREAIAAINLLANNQAAAVFAAAQAENDRLQAEKLAAKLAAKKAADEKKAADKAASEARKKQKMAAQNALKNFRPEDCTLIKFEEMQKGDYIKFDNIAGYTDVYPVYDLSNDYLYVIEGYNVAHKPDTINIDLAQFIVQKDKIVFIDEYDATNQAAISCYRKA